MRFLTTGQITDKDKLYVKGLDIFMRPVFSKYARFYYFRAGFTLF
jgi:hypothetical protein